MLTEASPEFEAWWRDGDQKADLGERAKGIAMDAWDMGVRIRKPAARDGAQEEPTVGKPKRAHVVPTFGRKHITDGKSCWCKPREMKTEGGTVIVHYVEQ